MSKPANRFQDINEAVSDQLSAISYQLSAVSVQLRSWLLFLLDSLGELA